MITIFTKSRYWQLSLFFLLMAMPWAVNAQTGNVDIGSGSLTTTAGSATSPITQNYSSGLRYQAIYTKDEIIAAGGAAGAITQMGWRVSAGATGLTNYTIRMGHTTANTITGSFIAASSLTQVHTIANYAPTAGYNMLALTNSFTWNGTSNIVVDVCYTRGSSSSSGGTVYRYDGTSGNVSSVYRSGSNPCALTAIYSNGTLKPQIRFVMAVPCKVPVSVAAGTVAATTASFSWSAPSPAPATGYHYGFNTSATVAPASPLSTTGTSVSVNSLTPGTTYYFWVRSRCSITSNSNWVTTAFTTPVVNNCSMPTGVTAGAVTATAAAFSWTAPATAPANGYYYGYTTSAGTAPASPTAGTGTSAALSGLTAGTGYYFWVRSRCSLSSNSEWVTIPFSTQCQAPVVTPAGNSRCANGSISLTASTTAGTLYWWDAAAGGNLLATGSSFQTPSLSSTTSYYVSAGQSLAGETTATIGAGSSTSILTVQNPFSTNNKVQSSQFIIKASELLAAGLGAGAVTSVSLDVATAGSVMNQFSIKLTNTTVSDLSNAFAASSPSNFYGSTATAHTPVVGINSFAGSFNWDGVSNIAVNISWTNSASGGIQTVTKADNTGFNSTRTTYLLTTSSSTYTTSSGTSRPKFILNGKKLCISDREEAVATVIERAPTSITAAATTVTCDFPAVLLQVEGIAAAVWSSTGVATLFTDADATIPYDGTSAVQQVYAKPIDASTTYTATAPQDVCAATSSVILTIPYKYWTGTASANWDDAANWSPAGVPTGAHCVIIPAGTDVAVAAEAVEISSVMLEGNAQLTVRTGTTLLVENAISVAETANLTIENNAALLQGITSTVNNNSGVADVYRYSNLLFRQDYTLWSSPVSGQNLYDFSSGTVITRFYTYTAATGHYVAVNPLETNFADASSYLIRMPNGSDVPGYIAGDTPMVFEGLFTGRPNNGNIPVTLAAGGDRYTAIGNPYPSPISVADVFEQGALVLDPASPIYLWRKTNQVNTPSYATLTTTAYTENEAAGGGSELAEFYGEGNEDNWMLAQGQGFIVKTRDDATQAVYNFTNSMRRPASTTGSMAFFRTAQNQGQMSRYWLNITNAASTSTSQIAVVYKDGATTGIDFGMDGRKFDSGNALALYTYTEDVNLTIQTRPAFGAEDVVPVGYLAPATGQYTISLVRKDGLFNDAQDIFLKDNLIGVTHDMKESSYTFTTEAGTFNSRFEVVYVMTPAMGTTTPNEIASSVVVYNSNNLINLSSPNALISDVIVFDVRGRELFKQTNVNAHNTSLTGFSAEQQVLIINVTTDKGKVSRKIVY